MAILEIIATLGLLIIVILSAVQTIRGKRPPIGMITTILLIAGVLLLVAFNRASEIKAAELVQIILTISLVAITAVYAYYTEKMAEEMKKQSEVTKLQAEASVRMAEEMREQRYDTVRPIIDIERRPTELERTGVILNKADKRERFPDKLACIFRNIGVGPATDIYSFVQLGTQPDDKLPAWAFGTIAKDGQTDEMPLSLKSRDNRKVLVAYYRDVYGRYFESTREVSKSDWKLGLLATHEITKEEFPK